MNKELLSQRVCKVENYKCQTRKAFSEVSEVLSKVKNQNYCSVKELSITLKIQ